MCFEEYPQHHYVQEHFTPEEKLKSNIFFFQFVRAEGITIIIKDNAQSRHNQGVFCSDKQ